MNKLFIKNITDALPRIRAPFNTALRIEINFLKQIIIRIKATGKVAWGVCATMLIGILVLSGNIGAVGKLKKYKIEKDSSSEDSSPEVILRKL